MPSYWEELGKWDLLGRLKPLLEKGAYYYDKDTCKIKKHEVLGINVPWVFIRRPNWMNCAVWHQVYFQCLNAIHSQCLSCYKIVVTPRTVKELFDLYELMVDLGLDGKCGLDTRTYTRAKYGGYFYTQTLEEGEYLYPYIRERISPELPVILKRGCTEFEMLRGDSSKYEQTEDDKKWEQIVEANIDIPDWNGTQPEILVNHIKRLWIAMAYKSDDMTALEFNDGEHLVPQPTTYHEPIEGKANG